MFDYYKQELNVGDAIISRVSDDMFPAGTEWHIICFGIEPSTQKEIAIIKQMDKNYICCAYQYELKYFKKKGGDYCA